MNFLAHAGEDHITQTSGFLHLAYDPFFAIPLLLAVLYVVYVTKKGWMLNTALGIFFIVGITSFGISVITSSFALIVGFALALLGALGILSVESSES